MKQVLSALRAIAGNDDVKDAIVRAGGTESIVAAMTQHLASPQVPTASRMCTEWGTMAVSAWRSSPFPQVGIGLGWGAQEAWVETLRVWLVFLSPGIILFITLPVYTWAGSHLSR